jgi:hypothetical protein
MFGLGGKPFIKGNGPRCDGFLDLGLVKVQFRDYSLIIAFLDDP